MLENMAQVQNYAYLLVSLKQISFVLFTYSMSRKKRGYIYVLKLVPTVSGNGQNELRPISWTQCQMIWEKLVIV